MKRKIGAFVLQLKKKIYLLQIIFMKSKKYFWVAIKKNKINSFF